MRVDLDRTLGELLIDWTNEFRLILRERLVKVDKEMVERFPAGFLATNELVYEMQKRYGNRAKKIVDEYCEFWEMSHYHGVKPNEFLVEWLRDKFEVRNLKFFLWTSNQIKTVERVLMELGLKGVFEKVVTANETKNIKPDPDGFRLIRGKSIDKDKYLFIGDSKWDELAAKRAGIDFVNVEELV